MEKQRRETWDASSKHVGGAEMAACEELPEMERQIKKIKGAVSLAVDQAEAFSERAMSRDNDTLREVPHRSNEGLALQARVSGPWSHKKESVLQVKLALWQGVQVQTVMDRV